MPHGIKHNQKGFTLHEMLLVIAISIILLAVSVVGILTYMRHLRLTELDNSAKEIFLAAQNRAVLLRNSQQLDGFVSQSSNKIENVDVIPDSSNTTQITVYYIHCDNSNIKQLLPTESIDPTLWEGDFWITYEPESGSVIDVFFCDQNLEISDFPSFYEEWRAASKSARMSRKPMVGYYGGESAQSGTTISLRTPVINIYNEDTLRAEVTYWVPRALLGTPEAVKLDVSLTYQNQVIILQQADAVPDSSVDISALSYTYTWTLDSLKESETQFYELFPGGSDLTCGGDFTITAEVSYEGSLKVNGAKKKATDNSLFAKDSHDETAYIACLRHLQNLDTAWSKVEGKTAAEQISDIQKVEDYTFQPIENDQLNRYDGQEYSIYDLTIGSGTNAAGLFGAFSGTPTEKNTLSNIRLVNTNITGNDTPTGALVGSGEYLTLTNCQVYWENRSEETTNLREVLGDSATQFYYQVTNTSTAPAGGLAGELRNSTIIDSSASTLVKSAGPTGGLVGAGSGLTIKKSYAASYLAGPAAAGLVGNLAGNANISGSYAVGFIDSKQQTNAAAAGLCLGSGSADVTSSYSSMLFTAQSEVPASLTNYPLCQNGSYDDTYYLSSDRFSSDTQQPQRALSYSELIDSTKWDTLFGSGVFTSKSLVQSHPYNLQTTLSLTTYIYPGLSSLDHWGDWGAQFQNGSLVYYEIYQDAEGATTYGFHGGNLSHLSDDKTVVQDGYAVAYQSTESISSLGATLTVTYPLSEQKTETDEFSYGWNTGDLSIYEVKGVKEVTDTSGQPKNYYLLPLPDEVVNSDYAAQDFYQEITIQDTKSDIVNTAVSYYYSPHFANTVVAKNEITSEDELVDKADQLQVEVRTPRHLYNLSQFEAYYASGHQYRFLQQLDLNYMDYTGYELFQPGWSQAPIGIDANSPFRCSYYGNHHRITGVVPAVSYEDEKYQYVGLFGYSTGVLQGVVYEMQETALSISQSGSSSKTLYAGALAGYNGGTMSNCAAFGVQLQASGYDYSTLYLGGLVGRNQGTIRNSAVEGAAITANTSMSNAYAGGFVGDNSAGGYIDQCYAVGKVSVTQARYGTVYACGFAGRSSAALSRSYAAVYLLTDGAAQRYGFCPDSSTHCVYLNDGNFTYRGENYVAQYQDPAATGVTWEALSGTLGNNPTQAIQQQAAAVKAMNMSPAGIKVYGDPQAIYPYPGTVSLKNDDGTLQYIHYGQWPARMELGTIGVYYWEKLTINQTVSYHISAISLMENGQVMKSGTLSTAHGDGGVVTEYGYGYFTLQGQTLSSLKSERIGYTAEDKELTDFHFQQDNENAEANAELSDLMGGKYAFHSFNTWGTKTDGQGLYVNNQADSSQDAPPVGTWTLNGTLTVNLNPFFADAMSYQGSSAGEGVPTALPGTEQNSYEVRSIDQLQFINWNNHAMNTVRRMDTGNMTKFPYLCYGTNGSLVIRAFYWEQTHDLEGAEDKTYTPIAGVYDTTNQNKGSLFGWFGGTYNGNDYMISDVDIAPYQNDEYNATSCMGLFGAVFDGTLKNIVLYSADGSATVTGSYSGQSRWYAIGALAGLAGSSTDGSAVINCTVAGYTIQDTHHSTSAGGWGGTGLGGLIGVSDMSLEGCTAVTQIVLNSTDNDNVRVGGLVGSCQGSISSSYAGGSITVSQSSTTPSDRGIYIGGIVGGIYMKPQTVGGSSDPAFTVGKSGINLENTLKNCYTYVQLPAANSNSYIKGLYAIGGNGDLHRYYTDDLYTPAPGEQGQPTQDRGSSKYFNTYYLESVVLQNNSNGINTQKVETDIYDSANLNQANPNVTALNYTEMEDNTSEKGLLYRLNSQGAGFSTVTTTTSSGNPLSGRYSFGCDESLLGRDYPFPTILTQSSDLVEGGRANVHYGDWPLAGIRRENGALPVNLDLFADYKVANQGAVHTEKLSLEGVDSGGRWSVESQDPSIALAALSPGGNSDTQTLSITGQQAGSTTVTVTYNTLKNDTYSLEIDVNVTAELRLAVAQSPVTVFTNETVQTPLELRDHNEKELPQQLQDLITLSTPTVELDHDYFTTASVSPSSDSWILTAESKTATGSTQMTVSYDFTYQEQTYHATSSIALNLVTPDIQLTPVVFFFGEDDTVQEKTQLYPASGTDITFTLNVNGTEEPLTTTAQITQFEEVALELKDIIWVEWAKNPDGTDQIGVLSIEASPQSVYPVSASVRVQFQFEYAGSTHTLWKDLDVQLKAVDSTEEGQS